MASLRAAPMSRIGQLEGQMTRIFMWRPWFVNQNKYISATCWFLTDRTLHHSRNIFARSGSLRTYVSYHAAGRWILIYILQKCQASGHARTRWRTIELLTNNMIVKQAYRAVRNSVVRLRNDAVIELYLLARVGLHVRRSRRVRRSTPRRV
jgi:hypothetical protein